MNHLLKYYLTVSNFCTLYMIDFFYVTTDDGTVPSYHKKIRFCLEYVIFFVGTTITAIIEKN